MRRINLADWAEHFPDGVSRATYARLGRLVKEYGTGLVVWVIPGDLDSLRAALDDLER